MKPLATTWTFRLRAAVSPILLLAILAAAPATADPSFRITFLVDHRSATELASPAVAVQGDGETAFVWRGECPQPGFCLSHYTPGQQPPTPPVLLDVGASVPDSPPRVAVGAGEELVVVWSEPAADGTRRVLVHRDRGEDVPRCRQVVLPTAVEEELSRRIPPWGRIRPPWGTPSRRSANRASPAS